jgi:hypothetical protein
MRKLTAKLTLRRESLLLLSNEQLMGLAAAKAVADSASLVGGTCFTCIKRPTNTCVGC